MREHRSVRNAFSLLFVAILTTACATLGTGTASLRGLQLNADVINDGVLKNDNGRSYTLYRLVPANSASNSMDGIVIVPHLPSPLTRFSRPGWVETQYLVVNRTPVGAGLFSAGMVGLTLSTDSEATGACYVIVNASRMVVPLKAGGGGDSLALGLHPYEDLLRSIRSRSAAERETTAATGEVAGLDRALAQAKVELGSNRAYISTSCVVPAMLLLPVRPPGSYPLDEAKARAYDEVMNVVLGKYGRSALQVLNQRCGKSQACFIAWALAGGLLVSYEIDQRVEALNRPYREWLAETDRVRMEPQASYGRCTVARERIAVYPAARVRALQRVEMAKVTEQADKMVVDKAMAVNYGAAALHCERDFDEFVVKRGTPQSGTLRTF